MRVSDLFSLGIQCLSFASIVIVVFANLFLVGYHLIYKKVLKGKKNLTAAKFCLYTVLACYMIMVLGVTLLNRSPYFTRIYRLTPFYSYVEAWYSFKASDWRNIILNIFMFVPLGLLLPYCHKIFQKIAPTALAGLLFSICIELTQFALNRGIFETDDLINNTLGSVIGYGLYRIVLYLYHLIRKEKDKIVPVLLYQLPLTVTILAFTVIFCMHDLQELGNLKCHYIIKAHTPTIQCNTTFDEGSNTAFVYIVPILTSEDTKDIAIQFFSQFGCSLDESRTDIYDESAFYYNDDNNSMCIQIDYEGGKITYTDFTITFSDKTAVPKENASKEELLAAIRSLGFTIPDNVAFTNKGDGNYLLEADCICVDDIIYDGNVSCRYYEGGKFSRLNFDIMECIPYKEFPIISEEEAYALLADGKFRFEVAYEPKCILVNDIYLSYETDSKGYYQPIYIFDCNVDGQDTRLYVPAI